ncbi:hypothetical protein QQM39_24620 [Streptomyces sp. DT2A-34]|uniref:hypothetical protein n=1 Tax=Streptomyces sp. DT2A-34 TaxID=3051182 RepID=UPI00265C0988|nr:hypothetical protein [Streptomyces sp. DT2A-34]MDO0913896.1 hypothetical protein [Streptomyces sp. DT2A-34]
MAITGLMVLDGRDAFAPRGWTKINKDLNAGAGGDFLYFAYETDTVHSPITNVMFVSNLSDVPGNYDAIPVDLNKGAGGEYIYAAYTYDPEEGAPIHALDVLLTTDPSDEPPKPWHRFDKDLNAGAGGKYAYLLYLAI